MLYGLRFIKKCKYKLKCLKSMPLHDLNLVLCVINTLILLPLHCFTSYDYVMGKIINIKSEILYRSAQDDFFYFNKPFLAYKKLKQALSLTPYHLKSLMLISDIAFVNGYTKKSLEFLLQTEQISRGNNKILTSIANCYFCSGNYSCALTYCDKIIDKLNPQNYDLLSQIFEMKIKIFMEQKLYKKAYDTYKTAKKFFNYSPYSFNYEFLSQKINIQKKLLKSNLNIV